MLHEWQRIGHREIFDNATQVQEAGEAIAMHQCFDDGKLLRRELVERRRINEFRIREWPIEPLFDLMAPIDGKLAGHFFATTWMFAGTVTRCGGCPIKISVVPFTSMSNFP